MQNFVVTSDFYLARKYENSFSSPRRYNSAYLIKYKILFAVQFGIDKKLFGFIYLIIIK